MQLYGGIRFNGDGIGSTVSAMSVIQKITTTYQGNVVGYNKVAYKKSVPVISSFAEFIGPHAVSVNKDDDIGKITITKKPLDIALGCKGYFQVQTENGVKLTRDGRFKLDKEGYLLNIENQKILSKDGTPIKFQRVPKDLSDIRIQQDGLVQYTDKENLKVRTAGMISVVDSEGARMKEANMKQGYIELSNVALQEEVYNMITLRRDFSANREQFKVQNEALTKVLQELGKA